MKPRSLIRRSLLAFGLAGSLLLPSMTALAADPPKPDSEFVMTNTRDPEADYKAYISTLTPEQLKELQAKEQESGFTLLDNMKQKQQLEAYLTAIQGTKAGAALSSDFLANTPAPPEMALKVDPANRPKGGVGDGRNSLDLSTALTGDILLGSRGYPVPYGWYSHNAIVDKTNRNFTLHAPGTGKPVGHDDGDYFKDKYDQARLMRVWASSKQTEATNYARAQLGDQYALWTWLWTENLWYCSKLVWSAYIRVSGVDMRSSPLALVVYPDDLYWSWATQTKAVSW